MSSFIYFMAAVLITFVVFLLLEPLFRGFLRLIGVYDIVEEGTAHVYVLFGKVALVVEEPGLQLLWLKMGPKAFVIRWLGDRHVLDTRLDQRYQRSLPVNSEEGAPMGIGVDEQLAQLFQWFGQVQYAPAEDLLTGLVPKTYDLDLPRAAAIWALGYLHKDDPPEQLVQEPASYTGQFLADVVKNSR